MTIFNQLPNVAFIYTNARPSNPVPNRPVVHEEGTGSFWVPFRAVHFCLNRTKAQILNDLFKVLEMDDDLLLTNKSMIIEIATAALDNHSFDDNDNDNEEEEE